MGASLLPSSFLSASLLNFIIFSLLPLQEQQQFQTKGWFQGSLVLTAILLISYLKVSPFIAFIIVSIGAGFALGIPAAKISKAIQSGIGDMMGSILVVICLGAMMGKLVAENIQRHFQNKPLEAFKPLAIPSLMSFGEMGFLLTDRYALASPSLIAAKEGVFQANFNLLFVEIFTQNFIILNKAFFF